jgi:hypothetical protein
MIAIKRFGSLLVVALLLNSPAALAETVTLQSGNGAIGGTDSQIQMLLGPIDGPFTSLFVPADFAAAQTGPAASIIANNGAWIATLPSNANARWISTGPGGAGEGGTALYAIDFTLAQPAASATLDLRFSVDNALGGGPNQGVYINGTAVSGNSTNAGFSSELSLTRNDIAPLLVPGTNTLYINSTDQGGPGGLIFSATIETVPIPEPGTLVLGFSCLGLLIGLRRLLRRNG